MKLLNHPIFDLLCELKLCSPDSVDLYYPRVRDRDDVQVLKCHKTGILFLSRIDHVGVDYYAENSTEYWSAKNREEALLACQMDDRRRADRFRPLIADKKWADIGTGAGGILDLLGPHAAQVMAVEPQKVIREELIRHGYRCVSSTYDLPQDHFDTISLFHVLEHFTDPLDQLRALHGSLCKGGKIIVEVPHANDFLISSLDVEAFKSFSFWSEHLILHTRDSLRVFLEAAGFTHIDIVGYQRYSLANHLFWLRHGKPGGHIHWKEYSTPEVNSAYSDMLLGLDKTDTLIALAQK